MSDLLSKTIESLPENKKPVAKLLVQLRLLGVPGRIAVVDGNYFVEVADIPLHREKLGAVANQPAWAPHLRFHQYQPQDETLD